VNPRKWIHNCNRELSTLITEYIDDESEWLTHLQLLRPLLNQIEDFRTNSRTTSIKEYKIDDNLLDSTFFGKFIQIRNNHKWKLVNFLRKQRKDPNYLGNMDHRKTVFSGLNRQITFSTRTILLIFYVIKRYMDIKQMVQSSSSKDVSIIPRVFVVGGISR